MNLIRIRFELNRRTDLKSFMSGYIKLQHLEIVNPLEKFLDPPLIPRSLCKWTLLEYRNLAQNKLTGKIPECVRNLKNLCLMRLMSNELSGIISNFIGSISSLETLNLNDNDFSGELPIKIWNFSLLRVLDHPNGLKRNLTHC
ncbi:putative non-specific serine/threonine protein kinase [Helianthus annuus]|uniref:Non-specific serine/threonine protein kinase n=2 Tax=Helianthus annuus TaxID=4232 RepID=A0A9K3J4W7_HELAN|nr:putative non-specific serine/threonine protein kinase [Helianthus annuus]KAJ0528608.1 putative non-specific serine/threonine protein kinase [Helianthus annuus]KAJ0698993.1 putative non-specific serine/threonine protein kinase [Helianthus annuus]KAJ0877938.1 putative non-specific serine/threonine protein kinase [Helianthus annuus]